MSNGPRVVIPVEERRKEALIQNVRSPVQQAGSFAELVNDLANPANRLTFNNPLDDILRGLIGGDLLMILARTGHGKTSLMLAMAKEMANRIKAGLLGNKDSIVIFASLEQNVEHIELILAGNEELDSTRIIRGDINTDATERYIATRPSLPLWVLGQTRDGFMKGHKELYLEGIIEAVESIVFEYDKRPVVLFLDYLQVARIRDRPRMSRHDQVMHSGEELKRLAMRLNIPVIYGSQARQAVDGYADKQPQILDSAWSGEASFVSDACVSAQLLARNFSRESHPEVEIGGQFYENTGKTMIVRVLKQRFEQGWGQVGFQFTPQTLAITGMSNIDLGDMQPVPKQGDLFGDEDLFNEE